MNLPAIGRRSAGLVCSQRGFGVARSRLMQDGEAGNRREQRAAICGMSVLRMRAPWLPPKTSRCGGAAAGRGARRKKSSRTGIPVTCGVAKIFAAAAKFTAAALTRLPTRRLASPGKAFGSKASVGMLAKNRGAHRRSGGVAADADDDVGAEVAQQLAAADKAERQIEQGASLGCQRNVLELANLDQLQRISRLRNQARFQAARRADEENLRAVSGL